MSSIKQAEFSYSSASKPTSTNRSMEYEAVAHVTRRLKTTSNIETIRFAERAAALHENLKLWTIFASDVANSGNPLPEELKARLFSLAEFTRHHTHKALTQKAPIEPLVEINTHIMRGLRNESV